MTTKNRILGAAMLVLGVLGGCQKVPAGYYLRPVTEVSGNVNGLSLSASATARFYGELVALPPTTQPHTETRP